jgi:hypothetical protein
VYESFSDSDPDKDGYCEASSNQISGTYLNIVENGNSHTFYDYDVDMFIEDMSYTLSYSTNLIPFSYGEKVRLSTEQAIKGSIYSSYPSSGIIRLSGANNGYISYTINSSGINDPNAVTIDKDINPIDGMSDAYYPKDSSWANLNVPVFDY